MTMTHKEAEVLLANALNDETCFALNWLSDFEFHLAAKGIYLVLLADYAAFDGMTVWGNEDEKDEVRDFLRDNPRQESGADFISQWRYRTIYDIKLFPEDEVE